MHDVREDYKVDFAIVTPLLEEWEAVRSRLTDAHEPHASYPTVRGKLGQYQVVVCKPPGTHNTGNPTSAAFTARVVNDWAPRWVFLTGVAGSLRKQVRPGDVVVATQIVGYEYGKIDRGVYVRRTRDEFAPAAEWQDHMERLTQAGFRGISVKWDASGPSRPDGDVSRLPTIHRGPIASGDKVVDDPEHTFFIEARESMPDLYAIEMEGAGAATAIETLTSGPRIGFLMIRGISDVPRAAGAAPSLENELRGTTERDSWKRYAAAAAAAVIEELLSRPGTPPPIAAVGPATAVSLVPSLVPAQDIGTITSARPRTVELLSVLQELGIVDCATRLESSRFEPKVCVQTTKRNLAFMGILASKWVEQGHVRGDFENLVKRIQPHDGRVRFLLIDPGSQSFKRLRAQRGGSISTGSISTLRTLTRKYSNFQVRLYDQLPTFRLLFVDEQILALSRYKIDQEGYFQSQYGWEAPHLVIEASAPWTLYDAFAIYFEEIWNRSKPL